MDTKEYNRARYLRERQIRINRTRQYRKNNPQRVSEYNRNYRRKYPEKFVQYTLKHYKKYSLELNISSARFRHAMTFWSAAVLKRDKHKCQICGRKAEVAHHILYKANYPKLSLNLNNGIALCQGCHYELHGYNIVRYPRT